MLGQSPLASVKGAPLPHSGKLGKFKGYYKYPTELLSLSTFGAGWRVLTSASFCPFSNSCQSLKLYDNRTSTFIKRLLINLKHCREEPNNWVWSMTGSSGRPLCCLRLFFLLPRGKIPVPSTMGIFKENKTKSLDIRPLFQEYSRSPYWEVSI